MSADARVDEYLAARLATTRRRTRRLLVWGSVALAVLFVLLTAGMRWVGARMSNPGLIVNDADRALFDRMPAIAKAVETRAAAAAAAQIRSAGRRATSGLPGARAAMEKSAAERTRKAAERMAADLPAELAAIAKRDGKELASLLARAGDPAGMAALEAFLAERVTPLAARSFAAVGTDQIDVLIAAHAKLESLKEKGSAPPEELLEAEILGAAARLVTDSVAKRR